MDQCTTPVVPESKARPRSAIYVDGFNLYFGVLKQNPAWRWLNLQAFFEALRPDDDVTTIKYCTAEVDPKLRTSGRRDRQAEYLQALQTLPKIQIIKGRYQMREVVCRAKICSRFERYETPEEKKTDVNLAVQMICDAIDERVDRMILISGDSDLEPAVEMIRKRFSHIRLLVYIPTLPDPKRLRANFFYKGIGVPCGELPLGGILHHQFPNELLDAAGRTIRRPTAWK